MFVGAINLRLPVNFRIRLTTNFQRKQREYFQRHDFQTDGLTFIQINICRRNIVDEIFLINIYLD